MSTILRMRRDSLGRCDSGRSPLSPTKARKPTEVQRGVLLTLYQNGGIIVKNEWTISVAHSTWNSLIRNGWIRSGRKCDHITPKGLAAIGKAIM